jgi:2-enoate reductase
MNQREDAFITGLVTHLDRWLEEQRFPIPHMTSNLHPYTHLFSPIQVNSITIKNRIVMGPMGNINMAEETGRPNEKMIRYFTERAQGGVGLITSGLVPICQGIDPTVTERGDRSYFPRIDRSRTVFSGWRILAENIHAYGAHFFIQLTPGLGRVGSPEVLLTKHKLPVSASWNPNYYMPQLPCRPLTDGECRRIIKAAGQAAADAKSLLIDGVYLHGHEGYLLEQMSNPAFNRRKLGSYTDWQAFGVDLVQEVRRRVGGDYPIMYRIDLSLALNATYGERMDKVRSLRKFKVERTVAMTLDYMSNLVKAGVDIFDVDIGCYDNWWLPHPPNSMPSGCYLEVAKLVKDFFAENYILSNTGMPLPVVGVGKLGYPDLAEQALRDGLCDMVMLARPLLADAEWVNKAFTGRVKEIVPCIGDQEACMYEFIVGGHPQCAVNPRTGFEDVYARQLPPVIKVKKIAVVGGGPAGILCATTAARRGHKVTLFEKRGRLGGMLVPGSTPRIKYEIANYLAYLENQVEICQFEHGLTVHLETEADAPRLKGGGYDSIVLCLGGRLAIPSVPGVEATHVIQSVDLLNDPTLAEGAKEIVVVGGGIIACECGLFLRLELGKKVTLVEILPHFMEGVCTANRAHLIRMLEQSGVDLLNCARLTRIEADQVMVMRNFSSTVPDPYNTWNPLLPENVINPLARPIREKYQQQTLKADLVVLATGLVPDRSLYETCQRELTNTELYCIGDAFQVGRVFEAVKAGYAIGRTV